MIRGADPGPRRILMTCDTIGGVWTYSLELARALQAHGVEVALASMGRRLSRLQREEIRRIDNLTVFESAYKLEWMNKPWADIERAGDWLLKLERQLAPDIVHLNGYAHAALPWCAPKLVVGHSCVLSWWRAVHGRPAPLEWERYRRAVSAGLKAAELTIAPSRAMLETLEQNYGPLSATSIIPNGRSWSFNVPPTKYAFILSAGRLWDPAKNIECLARIAPALSWPVYCAGDIRSPDHSGRQFSDVHWLGRLSSSKLWEWFARAAIYVLPARYEPFGLSVLEAALAGCVLVLGDIKSLRELWGDAAVYVSPDDPQELKSVLLELISSRALRLQLASRARQTAGRFTPERMASRYVSVYADLLRNAAARASHEKQTELRPTDSEGDPEKTWHDPANSEVAAV